MAEVVFRCSRFPHFWPWPRFQSHGHIVSPFSPRKDFSLLACISGAKTRQQRERRRVTPRFDAGSLTESLAKSFHEKAGLSLAGPGDDSNGFTARIYSPESVRLKLYRPCLSVHSLLVPNLRASPDLNVGIKFTS